MNRREVDDRESSMCARGLFYLIPSFRFCLAEQFLEIDPAFRCAGRTSRFSCVADLPVKPEPEVYCGCLFGIHHILPFRFPSLFQLVYTRGRSIGISEQL